jgi:hypothetical protein
VDMGCVFITFAGETLVRGLFTEKSPINSSPRISLTSLPDNMTYSGSCGNTDNILFFLSRGFSSSFYSDSIGI